MRVLFVTVPAAGHIFPLVPLAWALRAAGHEVLVASWTGADKVAESGLQWVDVAPGLNMYAETFARGGQSPAGAKFPDELRRFLTTDGRDRKAFTVLFSHVNDLVADRMVATARGFGPDLVVYECMSHSALVAAAALGVPAVQYAVGFQLTGPMTAAALPHLAATFARHGAEPPATVDIIHNVPASMAIGDHGRWPVRGVPNSGGATLPDWLARPADRPRVAITLGTVSPAIGGGLERLKRTVAAAAGVDAEFVVTMGGFDVGQLGDLPPNVRGADWLPWDALIRTCSAVIHHGGASVTLSGLYAGLPHLVLPDGADRDLHAAALRDRGVGLVATLDDIDTELLRRLVTDDKLRSAAVDARAEVAAMPSPAAMVDDLVRLAGR